MLDVPASSSPEFVLPVRVYYEDTDTGGVVYYANYLKFFERARTEWLRALGIDQQRLADETGCLFVVRRAEADYRRPARLDDLLSIHARVERLGKASIDFIQRCERGGELLANGRVQVGCVDRTGLRPTAMPETVRRALASLVVPSGI